MEGSRPKMSTTTPTKKNEHSYNNQRYPLYLLLLSEFSTLQLLLGIFVYAPSCIFCQIEGEVKCVCASLSLSARVCAYTNTYNSHYMHTLSKRILLSFAQQTFRFSTPLYGGKIHKYSNKHTVAHIRIRIRHFFRQYFPLCRLT